MIQIQEVSLAYGPQSLFEEISEVIGSLDRIALVGSNGSGKTTLLRMLMGQVEPDSGSIEKPDYATIGYLPQDGISVKGCTLAEEAEKAFADALALRERLDEAEVRLGEMEPDVEEFYDLIDLMGAWEEQLAAYEPEKMKSRIEKVLMGMGFALTDMNRDVAEFSGGWQMRIALSKLLLQAPSLLILDEPTNHMDIVSQHWLEQYLKRYQGALIVISHDRAFLETVTERTLELKLGKLNSYKGDFGFYLKESAARKERQQKASNNQKKVIQKEKEFINRFRSNVKKAAMVQSRIKALDKMEIVKPEAEEKKMYFRFPPSPPASHKVIEVENLKKAYGDNQVFNGLDLRIDKGDRIAIVGVNGAGKSTLVRILAGVEPFQEGVRDVGVNTVIGYFAQHQAEELNPVNDVLSEVEEVAEGNPEANPRAALGALLFSGKEALKKTSVLSGGERNRVALAKLLMKPCNCLIMDEPTNHLDIRSKEVLQEALNLFEGTAIIVSHDRSFLDGVVTKVLEVSPQKTRMLTCNVSEYIERLDREMAEA
ncbi:MAG: ABC-F family ATP-binding cassette domain-containing protein [Opitutae bacterium]|nr:ABC-F family ATP-binding cassette domain-containing protein [Opitutae bacterium]MBT5908497.1 ABC-F family ATP-binding cassette domain-containing protein [Opitutae bacterium]MBT7743351.1 ABC-F family ATP-binding cassette domain-containing protein [Opitutae bacterium]